MKVEELSQKRKPEKLKASEIITWIFLIGSVFLLFYWMLKMAVI